MARLFVAVWPPAAVLDAIEQLPRPAHPDVRWTSREQWHITLRFFGEADVSDARHALAAVRAEPTDAVLGPQPGRLGRSPGFLVLPIAGLDALAAAVELATAAVGASPSPRPFFGHITLARFRRRAACGLTEPVTARWRVAEVALVESTLDRDGSRYRTLAKVPLGGGVSS
jgi:RNA 2',3'-cyclic 3'-phosphodiesterase